MKSIHQAACTFCGNPHSTEHSGGEWHCHGGTTVTCCRRCAVDILPALIADSIYLNRAEGAKRDLVEVERTFWKAIACRAQKVKGA